MKKILIIEDDISIRELLEDILIDQGYQVKTCENGFEGMETLKIFIPDLILMDVMMPVMDGYTFRNEILSHSSLTQIPFIAMSAQHHHKEKLAEFSINNFICKPFEINHLLEQIKNIA